MNVLSKVFQSHYIDEEQAQKTIENKNIYVIAFTPRSGSSWLTEVLTNTKYHGFPAEWLNHNIVKNIVTKNPHFNFDHIDRYLVRLFNQKSSKNNTWGMETTWFQYELFLQMQSNFDFTKITKNWIWLRRKDIVAQGVSLYKAVESEHYHSTEKPTAKKIVKYNNQEINRWIKHILNQEVGFNNYFQNNNIKPLVIWYEDMMANKSDTLQQISSHLNINTSDITYKLEDNPHKKISDNTNTEFINKFKEKNKELLESYTLNRGNQVF